VRFTDPSQIATDTIFYVVLVFGDYRRFKNTIIRKCKAIDEPYENSISWWVKCIDQSFFEDRMVTMMKANFDTLEIEEGMEFPWAPSIHERSLQDVGVVPNTYNDHQTFDNYDDAVQYICDYYRLNFKDTIDRKDKYTAYERAMGIL
jgi:hypothetical protein